MSTTQCYLLKLFLLLMISLPSSLVLADPPGENGGTDDDPDNSAPIDGGITLLLATGIGYGAKKLYDLKKNKIS